MGFLFNINRGTNGSLSFFAVLKQGSYLRFYQTWRFIVDGERGPLFLEAKRSACLAFRASHVTWCLMMSFWSQKVLWDCVGGKECLLMRNRVQVCWHRGGSCLHAKLKPNQTDGVKPSRPTNVILQSNIQQIPDKHEQLWESPRNYQPRRQRLQKGMCAWGGGGVLQKIPETSRNCSLVRLNEWKHPEKFFLFNKIVSVMPKCCVRPCGHSNVRQTLSLLSGACLCVCVCVCVYVCVCVCVASGRKHSLKIAFLIIKQGKVKCIILLNVALPTLFSWSFFTRKDLFCPVLFFFRAYGT